MARSLLLVACLVLAGPREASADWVFTPFIGTTFNANTSFLVLEDGVGRSKTIFGGSAALLGDGFFGVEADFSYAPRFFDAGNQTRNFLSGSNVLTLSGSVIVTLPLSVTRESLRPYAVGGLGLMHATAADVLTTFSVDDDSLALNIGGGALGFISPRTGFRFEVRQFRSLQDYPNPLTAVRGAKLSFWRATVGVLIRP